MIKVLLVLHVFVTIALIGVVLIQRSEGGGLGLGGGQGMGNFMTGRGTANLLTRTTAILGTAFFVLSLGLALLYKNAATDSAAAILSGPPPNLPGAPPAAPAPLPQIPADAFPAPAPPVPTPAAPTPTVPTPGAPAAGIPAPAVPTPSVPTPAPAKPAG